MVYINISSTSVFTQVIDIENDKPILDIASWIVGCFPCALNLSQLFVSAMVTSGLNTAAAPAALEGLSTSSRGSSGSGQRPNTVAVATWIPLVLVSRAENSTKNYCFIVIVINSQCA